MRARQNASADGRSLGHARASYPRKGARPHLDVLLLGRHHVVVGRLGDGHGQVLGLALEGEAAGAHAHAVGEAAERSARGADRAHCVVR